MSPLVVDKKTKRKLIMKAALEVFAEQGTDVTKMADIGTLYEYFPSKEDLISGSVLMMMDELDTRLVERLYRLADPLEKVQAFIEETFEFFMGEQDRSKSLANFYAFGIPRSGEKPLIEGIEKRYREFIDWLASIIENGIEERVFRPVDSKQTASILLAAIDGLLFQVILGLLPENRSRLPESVLNSLVEGIKA
jgi:AcrR family transcriptional regulator